MERWLRSLGRSMPRATAWLKRRAQAQQANDRGLIKRAWSRLAEMF